MGGIEKIYPHDGEKTRTCLRCGEAETVGIDKRVPETTKADGDTNVDVGFDEGVLPPDTTVVVDKEFDGAAYNYMDSIDRKFQMFNVSLVQNGKNIQPNGTVLVRIPLPAGYNPAWVRVYYVSSDGSGRYLLDSVVENGYVLFETTHFSDYAIVDESANDASVQRRLHCIKRRC